MTSQYSELCAQTDIASLPSLASAFSGQTSSAASDATPQLQQEVAAKLREYHQQLADMQAQLAAEKARAGAAAAQAPAPAPSQRHNGAQSWSSAEAAPNAASGAPGGLSAAAASGRHVEAGAAAEADDARRQMASLADELRKKEQQLQRLTSSGTVRSACWVCADRNAPRCCLIAQ